MASRLITMTRRTGRPGCLLLPGAGGGFQMYVPLAAALGDRFDVYCLRGAGLVPGEAPELTVAQTAEVALREVDRAGIVPEVVFGWSMGAVVAWECAVRLADRGHRPDLVLVDGSPLRRTATTLADAAILDRILAMLGPNSSEQSRDLVRRTFQANVTALARHAVTRPYPGRILLLLCDAEDDFAADRGTVLAAWRALAGHLRVARLPAGHFDVFTAAHLPFLLAHIDNFIAPGQGVQL